MFKEIITIFVVFSLFLAASHSGFAGTTDGEKPFLPSPTTVCCRCPTLVTFYPTENPQDTAAGGEEGENQVKQTLLRYQMAKRKSSNVMIYTTGDASDQGLDFVMIDELAKLVVFFEAKSGMLDKIAFDRSASTQPKKSQTRKPRQPSFSPDQLNLMLCADVSGGRDVGHNVYVSDAIKRETQKRLIKSSPIQLTRTWCASNADNLKPIPSHIKFPSVSSPDVKGRITSGFRFMRVATLTIIPNGKDTEFTPITTYYTLVKDGNSATCEDPSDTGLRDRIVNAGLAFLLDKQELPTQDARKYLHDLSEILNTFYRYSIEYIDPDDGVSNNTAAQGIPDAAASLSSSVATTLAAASSSSTAVVPLPPTSSSVATTLAAASSSSTAVVPLPPTSSSVATSSSATAVTPHPAAAFDSLQLQRPAAPSPPRQASITRWMPQSSSLAPADSSSFPMRSVTDASVAAQAHSFGGTDSEAKRSKMDLPSQNALVPSACVIAAVATTATLPAASSNIGESSTPKKTHTTTLAEVLELKKRLTPEEFEVKLGSVDGQKHALLVSALLGILKGDSPEKLGASSEEWSKLYPLGDMSSLLKQMTQPKTVEDLSTLRDFMRKNIVPLLKRFPTRQKPSKTKETQSNSGDEPRTQTQTSSSEKA